MPTVLIISPTTKNIGGLEIYLFQNQCQAVDLQPGTKVYFLLAFILFGSVFSGSGMKSEVSVSPRSISSSEKPL